MPASNNSWGTSNFDCVEALTTLKYQFCRRVPFPEELQTLTVSKHCLCWNIKCAGEQHSLRNLKQWLCRSIKLSETSTVPASDIPCGTSNFDCVKTLNLLKHQVCLRATFPEEPQTLTVSKHWPHWNIDCAGERHSLRDFKLWLCQSIELTEASSMPTSNISWETSNFDCVED